MKCRDFQYEIGKEYEMGGDIEVCERGFHACENPMDVLNYYKDMLNDRYCVVEQSGNIDRATDNTKIVSSKIKVTTEIGWEGLFKFGIEWLREITNSEIVKTIDTSLNDNGGDSAHISLSGNYTKIDSTGDTSVIMCAGRNSVAKAKVGSWITLSEWKYSEAEGRYIPVCVKTEYVDGDRIKADTWYKLENGEFVEEPL